MGTNVPAIQWTSTGLIVPTTAAILTGVEADINAAFNGNLNFALNTPQGQLASSLTAIIQNCYSSIAYFVNQVNPSMSSGFMQDAIGYIYFLTRINGTATAVQATCSGVVGTVIPVGAQAADTSGNLYTCTEAGTIGSAGNVVLTFQNIIRGPIACPSGTLTTIYKAITGWESITNAADGVLGTDTESQAAFAARMQASVAVNAQGSLPSLYGALAALPGVTSVFCVENDTTSPVDVGSTDYSVAANSIYVAVVGGTASQIGQTIFEKKSPGCNTNGNTSVTVYDTSYPVGSQPSYTIKYNVPASTPISFAVTVKNSALLPSNITTLIQNAIVAQFQTGTTAVPAVSIASTILAANYFAPVLSVFQGLQLLSILIGTAFAGTGSVNGTTTLTISAVTSGFLAAGDYVSGTDIPANTSILSQLTGTPGGAGTYQMSNAATGSSSVTVTSTTGNLQSFTAGIDQIPTISAANITVTLE